MKQETATRLLNRAADGQGAAAAELLPLVYDELRSIAEGCFRDERNDHTLQPTALVHEAYLRLFDQSSIEWRGRNQFFAVAAKVMRNVLVDHARGRNRLKRGGGWEEIALDAVERSVADVTRGGHDSDELVRLSEALDRLAAHDQRKARLVELRFFAGLTVDEAADVLEIARSTASDEWRMARAWLHRELRKGVDVDE